MMVKSARQPLSSQSGTLTEMSVAELTLVTGGAGIVAPTCTLPVGSNQATCVCPAGTNVALFDAS